MTIAELIELEKESIKKEYETKLRELEELQDDGVGNLDWFRGKVGIQSLDKLKDIILYPFKAELEGKIVYYPDRQGVPFRFNKALMRAWLRDNFERIDWGNGGERNGTTIPKIQKAHVRRIGTR